MSWKDERGRNGKSRFEWVSDATWPDEEIMIGRYQDLAILVFRRGGEQWRMAAFDN